MIRRMILTTSLALLSFSCGIKGKPLPPLEPAPLGDGKVQTQEKIEQKNKNKKP